MLRCDAAHGPTSAQSVRFPSATSPPRVLLSFSIFGRLPAEPRAEQSASRNVFAHQDREEKEKKHIPAPSRSLSTSQLLSCPRGANVQLPNANPVRSYRRKFPGARKKKCQMDGDFLLGDFTGVVTVRRGREVPCPSLISGA